MSRVCQVCGKKPVTGMNISHSHIRTKRRWLPNLQKKRVFVKGKWVTLVLCTKCLKRLSLTTRRSAIKLPA
ncbi:MAG: 50S ribosomal protein L28 [bacterium JZ-2024 1]